MPGDPSSRFSARSEALSALDEVAAGTPSVDALDAAAAKTSLLPGGDREGDPVWAYARLLEALSMGVRWEPAIVAGEQDAIRFRDAAKARASQCLKESWADAWPPKLKEVAEQLSTLSNYKHVPKLAAVLAEVPLPVRWTSATLPRDRRIYPPEEKASPPKPVLVFLSLDGQALQSPLIIKPHAVYRLDVATKVDEWPEGSEALVVDFVRLLPSSIVEFGSVEVSRGSTDGSTTLQIRGPLEPPGRIEEFVTRAAFRRAKESEIGARVVGHPRLKISTFDSTIALPREMPFAARRLHEMIQELQTRMPDLEHRDVETVFTLLESLLRFAHGIQQDQQLAGQERISEPDFQRELKKHFYADARIGARLREHAAMAGGVTDLELDGIILELKVQHKRAVQPGDAHRYISQPAHYATATDRPVSLLCILDDSRKDAPPGVQANYMEWLIPRSHGLDDPRYPALVGVIIVPIRFPVPSSWSRAKVDSVDAQQGAVGDS